MKDGAYKLIHDAGFCYPEYDAYNDKYIWHCKNSEKYSTPSSLNVLKICAGNVVKDSNGKKLLHGHTHDIMVSDYETISKYGSKINA